MTPGIDIVVVTGGGQGTGRALRRRIARDAVYVVVAGLEPPVQICSRRKVADNDRRFGGMQRY